MYQREDVKNLASNRLKFEIVDDSRLELLVKQGDDDEDCWFEVCQVFYTVLEEIMGETPRLTCCDPLFSMYCFESSSDENHDLDLTFDR